MEAIETRNDEGYLKMAGLKMRRLATGVIVFTALFMMGLATEASAQSSSSDRGSRSRHGRRRVDHAAGQQQQCRDLDAHDEPSELQRIDDPHGQRHRGVHQRRRRPRRAGGLHHRQWDNPPVGEPEPATPGSTRMAVAVAAPTANGCIATARLHTAHVSNSANSIVVRARGTAGTESVSLRIDNTNVATWTLTTSSPELQRIDEPHRRHHRGVHQ